MEEQIGYVFFYGTLKQGQPLYLLEGIKDLRLEVLPARVQGGLLYNLGLFPGMILKSDGGVVMGEVHRFRQIETVLGILDEVEEYYGEGNPNNLYRRVEQKAELLNGEGFITCWVYEYVGPLEGVSLIKNGVWHGIGVQPH
ncbi:MAG: gamma-glutamylcyclotransferase [Deltaproteobacteria bacterium]|nr:MAG: gamma-glutamylcyclotransferase [Deltaproteobacteria bacterium]